MQGISRNMNVMNKILIVSEDLFLRDMVRMSLDGVGAEIVCVSGAAEAVPSCAAAVYDVVLVLGVGPLLGGDLLQAVRRVRQRATRVCVVAWQQAEQTVLGLLESGVDQYMTFPVSLHRLRAKVAGALRG